MDIRLHDQGTLIGFTLISDTAREFFTENVYSEDWQWLGPTLWVDQREARNLIQAVIDQGFRLEVGRKVP